MSTNYIVRFNHTGPAYTSSHGAALALVRDEAVSVRESGSARDLVVSVRADDGTYCYLSQDDADADDSGARVFATICHEDDDSPAVCPGCGTAPHGQHRRDCDYNPAY